MDETETLDRERLWPLAELKKFPHKTRAEKGEGRDSNEPKRLEDPWDHLR